MFGELLFMGTKFGNINLPFGIMLAPMAGYTDRAMRLVSKQWGCEYSVTEMVSAKAVVFDDKKTFSLARIEEDEGPVAIQIFGSEPEIMAEAASRLEKPAAGACPVAIDINMGCPVHKIFSNGDGSALMRSPELIEKIVNAVASAVSIPVTVKLRSGIDPSSINAVECALAAEAGGAAMVCVHGRTRVQMYGGKSDKAIIGEVKKKLKIPVIANGDVTSGSDALALLRETGADGIAVGRGAVGNPFIFSEILSAMKGEELPVITSRVRVDTALLQLRTAISDKGEKTAVSEARKQISFYLKGFRGASILRQKINTATTYKEVESAFADAIKSED